MGCFNRLYCCYGIPLCGENDDNLFSNICAFLVLLLLYQLLKNGIIELSKCNLKVIQFEQEAFYIENLIFKSNQQMKKRDKFSLQIQVRC